MEISKETSKHGVLVFKPVEKEFAREMCLKNHYSHKWNHAFGVHNVGIFRKNEPDRCLGVAVYGYMKNPKANLFVCPSTPDGWMIELNRMWISDEIGMNAESLLISASLKIIRKTDPSIVAVQSFADGRLGCGTIYKASNFQYYGFHYTKFLRNKNTGEVVHEQLFTNSTSTSGYLRHNILFLLNDYEVFRVKTYRYVYPFKKDFEFTAKNRQKYPTYEKGEEPTEWKRDKKTIKMNIIRLLDKVAA